MSSSTTESNYTRSNHSPDRSSRPTSILTVATSRSTTPNSSLIPLKKKPVKVKPRKPRPRPKSQPGDWNQLLKIPPNPSNTPSPRPILRATQSYTDLSTKVNRQNTGPLIAMGGNRTSLNMNGALDAHRRLSSYDEQYRYKDNMYGSARERVHRESPVIAELRTNVIVSVVVTVAGQLSC